MIGRCLLVVLLTASSSHAAAQAIAGSATVPTEKTAPEIVWDDLRWLMTALEAYASDNDWLYAPADGRRDGAVSDLDPLLEWYYENTFPERSTPPRVDPWGRPYRFVISTARKQYAIYSLGPGGKLGVAEDVFLTRVRRDQVTEDQLTKPNASHNLVVVSGSLVFAPAEVLDLIATK